MADIGSIAAPVPGPATARDAAPVVLSTTTAQSLPTALAGQGRTLTISGQVISQRNGLATVRTAAGDVRVPVPQPLPADRPVTLQIAPPPTSAPRTGQAPSGQTITILASPGGAASAQASPPPTPQPPAATQAGGQSTTAPVPTPAPTPATATVIQGSGGGAPLPPVQVGGTVTTTPLPPRSALPSSASPPAQADSDSISRGLGLILGSGGGESRSGDTGQGDRAPLPPSFSPTSGSPASDAGGGATDANGGTSAAPPAAPSPANNVPTMPRTGIPASLLAEIPLPAIPGPTGAPVAAETSPLETPPTGIALPDASAPASPATASDTARRLAALTLPSPGGASGTGEAPAPAPPVMAGGRGIMGLSNIGRLLTAATFLPDFSTSPPVAASPVGAATTNPPPAASPAAPAVPVFQPGGLFPSPARPAVPPVPPAVPSPLPAALPPQPTLPPPVATGTGGAEGDTADLTAPPPPAPVAPLPVTPLPSSSGSGAPAVPTPAGPTPTGPTPTGPGQAALSPGAAPPPPVPIPQQSVATTGGAPPAALPTAASSAPPQPATRPDAPPSIAAPAIPTQVTIVAIVPPPAAEIAAPSTAPAIILSPPETTLPETAALPDQGASALAALVADTAPDAPSAAVPPPGAALMSPPPGAALALDMPLPSALAELLPQSDSFSGLITGLTPDGRPVVDSERGAFLLQARTDLPPGTRLTLSAAPDAAADDGVPALDPRHGRDWPALKDALAALAASDPALAQSVTAAVPKPDGKLTQTLTLFLAALKGGGLGAWLGAEATSLLARKNPRLAAQLESDFQTIARQAEQPVAEGWRTIILPFGEEASRLHLHIRAVGEDERENRVRPGQPGRTRRFMLELDLSHLGPMQLDGMIWPQRFDLVVRTRTLLPPALTRELHGIYASSLTALGYSGGLSFQNGSHNWLTLRPGGGTRQITGV